MSGRKRLARTQKENAPASTPIHEMFVNPFVAPPASPREPIAEPTFPAHLHGVIGALAEIHLSLSKLRNSFISAGPAEQHWRRMLIVEVRNVHADRPMSAELNRAEVLAMHELAKHFRLAGMGSGLPVSQWISGKSLFGPTTHQACIICSTALNHICAPCQRFLTTVEKIFDALVQTRMTGLDNSCYIERQLELLGEPSNTHTFFDDLRD